MSSLRDRIELLEDDLKAVPPRISVYHDLPFAILRYTPSEEWDLRREARLLATRLEATGKVVHSVPMSEFLEAPIDGTEGLDEVVGLERSRGYLAAQEQVTTYLTDRDWLPLPKLLESRLKGFDPAKNVVFLTRLAAMAPGIYHVTKLFDQVQGKIFRPSILFYPGSQEGIGWLRFMGLQEVAAAASYRVKIYG